MVSEVIKLVLKRLRVALLVAQLAFMFVVLISMPVLFVL